MFCLFCISNLPVGRLDLFSYGYAAFMLPGIGKRFSSSGISIPENREFVRIDVILHPLGGSENPPPMRTKVCQSHQRGAISLPVCLK
jgi:hypothetical protein